MPQRAETTVPTQQSLQCLQSAIAQLAITALSYPLIIDLRTEYNLRCYFPRLEIYDRLECEALKGSLHLI